jgi:hypothetical protein
MKKTAFEKRKWKGIAHVSVCVVLFASLPIKNVLASTGGMVKVESNGFLRRSEDRSDNSSTISIGPRLSSNGKILESKLDAEAIVQVTDTKTLRVDRRAFTVEAANAYFATSKQLMSKHQFTLGRRVYQWSKFDREWEFGAVSPRFIWDPTRPQIIGLTGVFHSYETKHWRWLSYGSPLSIPERGYPLRNENGKLLSSNPFYNPYFDSAVIAKVNLPIEYTVVYPAMSSLLFNPGGTTSLRWSSDEGGKGFWVQGMYGFLPIVQPNLAIQASVPAQRGVIEVEVHPTIQRHHLGMLEAGITRANYSIWASVMREKPTNRVVPSSWIATREEPASIYSAGGHVRFGPKWQLSASYIYVSEERTPTVEEPDFTIDLPGRFPYHRAARGRLDFQANERMNYALSIVSDLEYDSQMMSVEVLYRILKKDNALTLSVGSDFFASSTEKGYLGQHKGNDRVRGGVGYAF